MKNHSIVFIDNFPSDHYSGKKKKHESTLSLIKTYFKIYPNTLPKRIGLAFVPPILGSKSRCVYVDFVGPCLAIITLSAILHYGHAYKLQTAALSISPSEILLYYCVCFVLVAFFLAKLGQAALSLVEVAALIGYGLYGHIFTLVFTQLIDYGKSNEVFFINLIIFGGLSSSRIALVLQASITHPASRFLVCTITTVVHTMFTIFIQFAYMHSTFLYGSGN